MKYFLLLAIFVFLFTGLNIQAQQITTNSSFSLEQLILNNFAEGCVEISNISSSVNGSVNGVESYGYFERGSSSFPFEKGIVLSTGSVNSAGNVLNTSPLHEGSATWQSDPDLEAALNLNGQTVNATVIEFDFTSVSNQIQFNYLLASEEYFSDNPCNYSDGFTFLIKEAGTTNPYQNIAKLPNTNINVNTFNIHDDISGSCPAQNEQYFEGYNLGDTNFNGRTTVLSATASIQPYTTYHIKLVVADFQDQNFDSAVFIEGNSFNASVDLGPDISTCDQSVVLNGSIQNNQATYKWYFNDALMTGENGTSITATATGTYKVEIAIALNNTSCTIEDEVEVTLSSAETLPDLPDFILCDYGNDNKEFFYLDDWQYFMYELLPPSDYSIKYFLSESNAQANTNVIISPIQNSTNPQTIYARAQDIYSGCLYFSTFNIGLTSPDINTPEKIEVCDDHIDDSYPEIDLNLIINDITGGNPNYYTTFHHSQLDAEYLSNPVDTNYININDTDILYIGVYDATTGCVSTTSVEVTVISNPIINPDPMWIDPCEIDEDGFAEFDLTSVVDNILLGLTGVTVTFHEIEDDAHAGSNPISNETNYTNIVQTNQIVYVRVEDDATGCHSNSVISLVADTIQTAEYSQSIYECDDISDDGIVDFDLVNVEAEVTKYTTGYVITFYETKEDQDNDTNPLDKTILFTVDTTATIYATIVYGDCINYVTIPLVVEPTIVLPPIINLEHCDEDFDGYTSLSMTSFNDEVAQGVNPNNVKYYLTESDAINNVKRLPPYFRNLTNPQTVFVRVTNPQTECYSIGEASINVISAPIVYQPNDIVLCDDDTDGTATVNLETIIPEIGLDPLEHTITFHMYYDEAWSNSNVIVDPQNYTTTSYYLHSRIENNITGCFTVIGFSVIITPVAEIIPVSIYENCEAGISGIADFYFYLKDEEILNGQQEKEVIYYETEQEAIDGINPISKWDPYQNTSTSQLIYYRIQSYYSSECFKTSSFELNVGALPMFNTPVDITVCDDISNDRTELFNLNDKLTEITDGITEDLVVTFHPSEYDASNGFNPLPMDYNNVSNPQQVYARIENGTYCHAITSFIITIIPAPSAELTPETYILCDTDYNETVTFDLTTVDVALLDPRVNNIDISYFTSIEDTESDENPITDLTNFVNTSNPQTVFIKVNNNISDCFVTLPLELVVDSPPAINEFETYQICDNSTRYFNLNEINSVIVDNDPDALITYYTNSIDAESGAIPLPTDYTYSTISDTIYIRIESASRGCHYVYPFQLIVNPLPVANQPMDMEACDDVSADGFEYFDLSMQNTSILGGQDSNNFTITYHDNPDSAVNNASALSTNYNAQNGQIIYVRIENNVTGCFSTTQFNTIVHQYPNQVPVLVQCDVDYDETVVFDISANENSLFASPSNNIAISYFDDLSLIEDDTSAILDPFNYVNLTNPQTIYIKVFNISADCYNVIEQELNVTSPPAINEFETYETCDNPTRYFNLNEINAVIVDNDPDALITYYTNSVDAENGTLSISNDYTYATTNDTIYIRIESASRGCHYVYPFQLVVNPLPIANQPLDMEACDDDHDNILSFNLSEQNSQILGNQNSNDFTISYYLTQEEATTNLNSLNINHNINVEDLIYARIENNSTGCFSTTSFMVYVRRKPINDIEDQVICLENFPLQVDAETGYTSDSYLWMPNGETTPNITITEIGAYNLTITSSFGCISAQDFNVIESEQATIEFEETIDFSDPNNITITVSGIGDYLYQLDDGEPQRSNFFTYVPIGPRIITVIDANGCSSVSKEVMIFDVPKFVTPNNDGYFDTWHITGVNQLAGTIVHIYNRYGKLIKTLPHTSLGWDGTYNGRNMPADDYWYTANVFYKGEELVLNGHFTLKR